jgi:hypothetical protein
VAEGVEVGLRVAAVVSVELGVDDFFPVEDGLLEADTGGARALIHSFFIPTLFFTLPNPRRRDE